MPIHKVHQKQFIFSSQGQQSECVVLSQGYINSPALCHNRVRRDLDHLSPPQSITLVHCVYDMILTGLINERQKLLCTIVKHVHARGWEINPTKAQRPASSLK